MIVGEGDALARSLGCLKPWERHHHRQRAFGHVPPRRIAGNIRQSLT
jgi:hypothetical protein